MPVDCPKPDLPNAAFNGVIALARHCFARGGIHGPEGQDVWEGPVPREEAVTDELTERMGPDCTEWGAFGCRNRWGWRGRIVDHVINVQLSVFPCHANRIQPQDQGRDHWHRGRMARSRGSISCRSESNSIDHREGGVKHRVGDRVSPRRRTGNHTMLPRTAAPRSGNPR